MSKHTTALSLYDSMSAVRNTASMQTVFDISPSLLIYVHCLLPFSQALLLTLTSRFCFSNIKESIALVCSPFVIILGSTGKTFQIMEPTHCFPDRKAVGCDKDKNILEIIMSQYSLKEGLKRFGIKGGKSVTGELS